MARSRRQPQGDNLSDAGTSSVANRRKAEAERQATAREARDTEVAELKKAHAATARRLKDKPTDTRTISA